MLKHVGAIDLKLDNGYLIVYFLFVSVYKFNINITFAFLKVDKDEM